MLRYVDEHNQILNFILAGNRHSGYGLLHSSLALHPLIVCHDEILSVDENIRKNKHRQHFTEVNKFTDYFESDVISIEQYLNTQIFNKVSEAQRAVGIKTNYDSLQHYDLWDYMLSRTKKGDFCVIHVKRNPVACYIAKKQFTGRNEPVSTSLLYIEPQSLTDFCRKYLSTAMKIDQYCPDRFVVYYHELILDFSGVLSRLFDFLDLNFEPVCVPTYRRLHCQEIQSRIANWNELQTKVPLDIRELLEDPLLY